MLNIFFACCLRLFILAFNMRFELVKAAEFSLKFLMNGRLFRYLWMAFLNEIKDDLLYSSPFLFLASV